MLLEALDAAVWVAGDDDAAVGERVGVEVLPDLVRDRLAAGEVEHVGDILIVPLRRDVAREVLLEVIGHTAPLFEQPRVHVLLSLHVGPVGAKEVLQRGGSELARLRVVVETDSEGRVAPLVVDERADRVSLLDVLPVSLDVGFERTWRAGTERQHADSLRRRDLVRRWLERGHPDRWMRVLVRLGEYLARRHLPVLTLVLEPVGLPDLRDHCERLLPHLPAVPGVDAHAGQLVRRGASGAEVHPALGQVVEHRDSLGDAVRMMIRQYHNAETEPDLLRPLTERGVHQVGARRR